MIVTIIILIIIAISVAVALADGIDSGFGAALISGFIGICLVIVIGIFAQSCMVEVSREDIKIPIYSLAIKDELQGRFYLGSGMLQSTQVYYFYTKQNDFYQLRSANALSSRIKEIEKDQPFMHYQNIEYRFPTWFMPKSFTIGKEYERTSTDLYIPKDSIVKSFNPNP